MHGGSGVGQMGRGGGMRGHGRQFHGGGRRFHGGGRFHRGRFRGGRNVIIRGGGFGGFGWPWWRQRFGFGFPWGGFGGFGFPWGGAGGYGWSSNYFQLLQYLQQLQMMQQQGQVDEDEIEALREAIEDLTRQLAMLQGQFIEPQQFVVPQQQFAMPTAYAAPVVPIMPSTGGYGFAG